MILLSTGCKLDARMNGDWRTACVVWIALIFLTLVQIGDTKPYERTRRAAVEKPISEPCQLDRYRCGTKCIPLQWICDGYIDCDDKLDERNCIPANQNATIGKLTSKKLQEAGKILEDSPSRSTSPGCSPNMFSCDKGDKCLKMSSLCDTLRDCDDGSDETNCPAKSSECENSKFSCDSGAKCLPLTWLCDSIDDCIDHKDEHNCPATKGTSIAKAAEAAALTAAQEAKRAAYAAQEMMRSAKAAANKAKRARHVAEAARNL